jgi:hypothetical protein
MSSMKKDFSTKQSICQIKNIRIILRICRCCWTNVSKSLCQWKYKNYIEVLKSFAMRLGSAFQKVNFLRDLKADLEDLK